MHGSLAQYDELAEDGRNVDAIPLRVQAHRPARVQLEAEGFGHRMVLNGAGEEPTVSTGRFQSASARAHFHPSRDIDLVAHVSSEWEAGWGRFTLRVVAFGEAMSAEHRCDIGLIDDEPSLASSMAP